MKKVVTLFIIVIPFSLNAQNGDSSFSIEKIHGKFTFLDPVFTHNEQNNLTKEYDDYEKLTRINLDLLFYEESYKYRILEKLSYLESKMAKEINNEIVVLFNLVSKNKTDIPLPPRIKSIISKTDNQYGLLIKISPIDGYLFGRLTINKIILEIIIVDLINEKIVFYKKSKTESFFNIGGEKALVKSLDYVFDKKTPEFKYYNDEGDLISRKKFGNKAWKGKYIDYYFKNDSLNIQMGLLVKSINYDKLDSESLIKLRGYLNEWSNKQVDTTKNIILNYLSMTENTKISWYTNWDVLDNDLSIKLNDINPTEMYWINSPKYDYLLNENKINWIEDNSRKIEKLFFNFELGYVYYVIVKPNGQYFYHIGEYGKKQIFKNYKKFLKRN